MVAEGVARSLIQREEEGFEDGYKVAGGYAKAPRHFQGIANRSSCMGAVYPHGSVTRQKSQTGQFMVEILENLMNH